MRENDSLFGILNGFSGFIDFENVGFALLAEMLKIFDFCGGHFEFLSMKKIAQ